MTQGQANMNASDGSPINGQYAVVIEFPQSQIQVFSDTILPLAQSLDGFRGSTMLKSNHGPALAITYWNNDHQSAEFQRQCKSALSQLGSTTISVTSYRAVPQEASQGVSQLKVNEA